MRTITTTEEVLNDDFISKYKKAGIKQNGIMNGTAKNIPNGTNPEPNSAGILPKDIGTDYNYKRIIVWKNVLGFAFLHIIALWGLWVVPTLNWKTNVYTFGIMVLNGQGVTMGAHRLYAHKTFKASLIVRVALIILQTLSGQNCLYVWARDHRQHHKYSDTDADPHNSNRGFFFSHMGWLMSKKHPAVIIKGKTIDMSDLEADRLVMFQKQYYKTLYLIFAVALPLTVPIYVWNETYLNAFLVVFMLRYILTLHATWLVNSAAHMFGTKPYDKTMRPVESFFVTCCSNGEGWHNYHHAFPWDYRASELGTKYNFTTIFIDILASVGLVYDLKSAPMNMVEHRALKAGDGSHPKYGPLKIVKDALLKEEEENCKEENENYEEKQQYDIHLKTGLTTNNTFGLKTNGILKKDLDEEEYYIDQAESIFAKDLGTIESTIFKRTVKEKQLLHGISSFGFGCAIKRTYGVYTDVSHFLDWIKGAMELHNNTSI